MNIEQNALYARITLSVTAGTAGPSDVAEACELAAEYRCGGIIVNPCFAIEAVRRLRASGSIRCEATVSFPLGCDLPAVKLYAAEQSVLTGCTGILLAMNAGLFRSGAADAAQRDLELVHASISAPMSAFVNAAELDDAQLTQAVHAAIHGGAASVVCAGGTSREVTPKTVSALVAATSRLGRLRIAGPMHGVQEMTDLLEAGADGLVLDLAQARTLLPALPQHP